jgi:cytidylate kinase
MANDLKKLAQEAEDAAAQMTESREAFLDSMSEPLSSLRELAGLPPADVRDIVRKQQVTRQDATFQRQLERLKQLMPNNFRGVVAVAGKVGAGKHQLAEELATELGFKHASFGQYVRGEAKRRDVSLQRRNLQDLGDQLISEQGWDQFVRNTLKEAGVEPGEGPVVVDGVRHLKAREMLRDIYKPQPVITFFLDTDDQHRFARLESEGVRPDELEEIEHHPTEEDTHDGDLEKIADQVLGPDEAEAYRQAIVGLARIVPALAVRDEQNA